MRHTSYLLKPDLRSRETNIMKIQDIRKKTEEDLLKFLVERKEEVRSLRFKVGSSEIKNFNLLSSAKRDIAKILTIMRERKNAEKAT